jgi:hypothetical protein
MLGVQVRFDALDFEQTVADLAWLTPRSASRAFGRTDATLPSWPNTNVADLDVGE